jgi:type II restriction/modification system DNA methylase subunit YeeA
LAQPREGITFDQLLGFLNSKVADLGLELLNPTINLLPGTLGNLPAVPVSGVEHAAAALEIAETDWDAFETSWDFTALPLLSSDHRAETLEATYASLRAHWQSMTDEMQRLEEENNRIFIDAYGLQDELTPEVPLEEITLTCNPAYRYGVKSTSDELETVLTPPA